MPPANVHRCPALDCTETVPARMLMCIAHWKLVPKPMQDKIWKAYRLKWRGGRFEADHYNACKEAIEHVRATIQKRRDDSAQGELL